MSDIQEKVQEAVEEGGGKLNSRVAVVVALVATMMAIGNIKDGNIVQNMAQIQAKAVGQWNYYQAKSTKQLLAENAATILRAQGKGPEIDQAVARYESEAKRYETEKQEIRKTAEGFESEYERLNIHDDQFDMAEACFTLAITLAGVSALTRKGWLLAFGSTLAGVGLLLEVAGFLQWGFHPEWLAKLLG